MSDDMNEFMEMASSGPTQVPEGALTKGSDPERRPTRKERLAALNQYAKAGNSFTATGDTTKLLPPDCYTISMTMEGAILFKPQNIVTDSLLRLPDSKSDEVISEVERFWTLKEKFKEYGFAHKRGFLLWGPPGSGKTSTVAILINDMIKRGGLVVLCDNPGIMALGLSQIRIIEPDRPIVVILEDLDTIIMNYGESTVLSLLDGEAQIENVCYLATTNYPEKLDGRIINRPSRFDRIVKIGMPNAAARKMYLESRIKEVVKDGIDLVDTTEGLSVAHLKELIISVYCQGNSVQDTLQRLNRMKVRPKSDNEMGPLGLG